MGSATVLDSATLVDSATDIFASGDPATILCRRCGTISRDARHWPAQTRRLNETFKRDAYTIILCTSFYIVYYTKYDITYTKYTKYIKYIKYKIYKNIKVQNLQKIQNVHYAIFRKYEIEIEILTLFFVYLFIEYIRVHNS